jgi:hypothetical protein
MEEETYTFTDAKYVTPLGTDLQPNTIRVTINGQLSFIPITDTNKHYVALKAEIDAGRVAVEDADVYAE